MCKTNVALSRPRLERLTTVLLGSFHVVHARLNSEIDAVFAQGAMG